MNFFSVYFLCASMHYFNLLFPVFFIYNPNSFLSGKNICFIFWENTFIHTSFRMQSLLSSAMGNLADNGLTFDPDIWFHFATRAILNAISALLRKVTQSKKLDWAVCMWLKDKYSSNHLGIKVFSCRLSWAERLNPILFLHCHKINVFWMPFKLKRNSLLFSCKSSCASLLAATCFLKISHFSESRCNKDSSVWMILL